MGVIEGCLRKSIQWGLDVMFDGIHHVLRMSEKRANKEDGEIEVVSDPISDQSDQRKRGHNRDGQKGPSTQ